MIKINLLPVKEARKKEKVMTQLYVGVLAIILAIAVMGLLAYSKNTDYNQAKTEFEKTKADLDKLKQVKADYDKLRAVQKKAQDQLDAIDKVKKDRDWFIWVVDKISESVPRNLVWLTSIGFGKSSRAGQPGAKDQIVILGKSYDRDSIAVFMGNLSVIPCDDDKPEAEKAAICRDRNNQCMKVSTDQTTTVGNASQQYNFKECKKFYADKEDEGIQAQKKLDQCVDSCAKEECKGQAENKLKECVDRQKLAACKPTKALKCAPDLQALERAKADNLKLHKEEFIVYDKINLSFANQSKTSDKEGGIPVYEFEIDVQATEPH